MLYNIEKSWWLFKGKSDGFAPRGEENLRRLDKICQGKSI